jgi:polyisoprenoid-binding protein YceI
MKTASIVSAVVLSAAALTVGLIAVNSPSVAVAAPATAAPAAAGLPVDGVHSYVVFRIKHDGLGANYGRFNTLAGTFDVDPANPTSGSIEVTVQTDSIDTGNAGRDRHLKSGEFFDAKQFPTITFKSTGIKKGADGKLELAGNLTLLGKTKPVTAALEVIGKTEKGLGVEAKFTIKRSEFGMTAFADRLSDEVNLIVALEGQKK